ncbi:arsenical efflux pump membrane protein ArsB [Helicobacter sp. 11S03491-1]|uniref:arsenical efflux pump membrane protein ArsB n=1 Tax=Helicobacter sp. 11S03491-1 TaxID=1476196 RepID=UPI000BA5840F|nr:arsenical efflux pump membrane protein ArsB [Helicobacter sp. 11S03491-1]PAF42060.1 arsenic transporter [Helicobacter sp. 11S03491-1]
MLLSLIIFILTMAGVICRPFGLGFGSIALMGAGISLLGQTVSLKDALFVVEMVWNATFSLVGLIILSIILDKIGFFESIALWIAKHSFKNPKKLFVFILVFGSILSAILANDGAVLILTPIIFALMKHLQAQKPTLIAFVLGVGFIVDTTSNPLITSNLTNIITASFFQISFVEYAKTMFIPNLVAIISSILVLYLYFGKILQKSFDASCLPSPATAIKSSFLFGFSWGFLGLLLIGFVVGDIYHLPISLFALGGSIVFLMIAKYHQALKITEVLKSAPWQVVYFSIGLYIVVYGLKNAGVSNYLSQLILWLDMQGKLMATLGIGVISAFLSATMNNMPTVMIQDIAIKDTHLNYLAFSNIIGCNLGTKFTPIGSLATLLWLHVLATKKIKISWLQYCKIGFIITPPVLLITLFTTGFIN